MSGRGSYAGSGLGVGRRRTRSGGLEVEQDPLGVGAAVVLADRSVGPHDPVARHDDGHRVVGAGRADRPHRGGTAGRGGHPE